MVASVETDGCSLSYKVEGRGEPVVFIQGVGLHGDGWLPQTQALKAHFQCVTFDNRGMGRSQPAGCEITIDRLTKDTLAVMDAAGIDSAHLIGHSLGGSIAQQVALMAPNRVKSLALLCTSANGSDATKLTSRMLWLGLRSRIGPRRMRARAFLEIVMPADYLRSLDRDALAERLKPLFGHDLADSPPIVMRQLKALKRFNSSDKLSELTSIPTLVLSAAHDMIFSPTSGKGLASRIAGARYIEIAEAAHGVTIQSPEIVNRHLLEHLRFVST